MNSFFAGFNKVSSGVLALAKGTLGMGGLRAAKNFISRGGSRVARTANRRSVLGAIRKHTNVGKGRL